MVLLFGSFIETVFHQTYETGIQDQIYSTFLARLISYITNSQGWSCIQLNTGKTSQQTDHCLLAANFNIVMRAFKLHKTLLDNLCGSWTISTPDHFSPDDPDDSNFLVVGEFSEGLLSKWELPRLGKLGGGIVLVGTCPGANCHREVVRSQVCVMLWTTMWCTEDCQWYSSTPGAIFHIWILKVIRLLIRFL